MNFLKQRWTRRNMHGVGVGIGIVGLIVGMTARCALAQDAAAGDRATPVLNAASLTSILSLRANQPTGFARGRSDRTFVYQPAQTGGLAVWDLAADSTRPIAFGLPAETEIRAVAVLSREELLLYLADTGRAKAGGLYRVRLLGGGPATRVLDADAVAAISGLGGTLTLAEAQMTTAGSDIWLILRNPDQTAFCRLDVARLLAGGPRLARPFEKLTGSDSPASLRRDDVWTGRPYGTLDLFRPSTGEAWRIDGVGQATAVIDPITSTLASATPGGPSIDRPTPTAPPLNLPGAGRGRTLRFFPDYPRSLPLPPGEVRYPAFVVSDGKTATAIERDAIKLRPGFPAYGLRLTAWFAESGGNGAAELIAYDAMSGEVFRVKLARNP